MAFGTICSVLVRFSTTDRVFFVQRLPFARISNIVYNLSRVHICGLVHVQCALNHIDITEFYVLAAVEIWSASRLAAQRNRVHVLDTYRIS